jgi:hypothetical protein
MNIKKIILLSIIVNLVCFNFCYGQTIAKIAEDIVRLNLFIEQTSNKTSVYLGETFYCDYNLIVSNELILTDMKLKKMPSFMPFKSQEVNIKELKYTDTIIDGFSFKKSLLHRYLLTPRNVGEANIDGIEFEIKVKIPLDANYKRQNPEFANDDFYEHSCSISSTPKKINVIPLPPHKEKCAFVGDFEIDYLISKITAKKNENILLSINVVGIGSLSVPFVPNIEKTEGLKTTIYKTFDTFEIINNEIISRKTYEVDLIATVAKEYVVYGIEILCFSPTMKEYYYLRTDAIPIFFIENENSKDNETSHFVSVAYVVVFIGVIALIIIIFYYSKHLVKVGKRVPKTENNTKTKKSSTLDSDTSKIYLSKAFHCINDDFDIFLRELNLGIEEYIRERFQIEKNTHSKEQIVQVLEKNGIPSTVARNYLELSNKIEEVRFSKTKLDIEPENIARQKLFSFVEAYINELDGYNGC